LTRASEADPDRPVISKRFTAAGGVFVTPPRELARKLKSVRALVFDWDGVFNAGAKGPGQASTFSEPDSMGTNMLRYGLWLQSGVFPKAAIITGAHNPGALEFARRECFDTVYAGVLDKQKAIAHLCDTACIQPDQVICVFDDINDLGMAECCGLRCMVRRPASPLLQDYAARQGCCDYITGQDASGHAVREVSELLLGLMGQFDTVVRSRSAFDEAYQDYLAHRQAVHTDVLRHDAGQFVPAADR